jgi:hypothetical protein
MMRRILVSLKAVMELLSIKLMKGTPMLARGVHTRKQGKSIILF